MKESYTSKRRVRKNFGRIDSVSEMPSLIEVQTGSYRDFIENKNCEFGLEEVFKSIFPIKDFSGTGELEFVKYELEEPKYDVDECIKRDMTYAAPVKATLRLVVWDVDEATGSRSIHDIKEQDVYMGDIPLMTDKGTFIVNGTERVVVSQMHRSPGVFFDNDKGKTVASGKYLFAARVIPYRGSWLDFEFDAKDLLYARIDRRRKLPVTSILYSLYSKETEEKLKELAKEGKKIDRSEIKGMDKEEILSYFYDVDTYVADKKGWKSKFVPERFRGVKFAFDLIDAESGKTVWESGKKIPARAAQKLVDEGLEFYRVAEDQLLGKFLATALVEKKTGEGGMPFATRTICITRNCWTRSKKPKSTKSRFFISTTSMSGLISATLWKWTRTTAGKMPCLTSIALCVRANRLHTKLPTPCSNRCSSTTSAMICLRSAA